VYNPLHSVRGRLTLWQTAILALVLVIGASTAYVFFRGLILERVDRGLSDTADAFAQSLKADQIAVGGEARAVLDGLNEFRFRDISVIVYDRNLHVVGTSMADPWPPHDTSSLGRKAIAVMAQRALRHNWNDRKRMDGFSRLYGKTNVYRMYATSMIIGRQSYVLAVVQPLDEEQELLRRTKTTAGIAIALTLLIAGLGGALLADRSLAPVAAMTAHAARIGAQDSGDRLPVHNPHDELGRLALVFNDLLGRLHDALNRQRQFMADASHELRTPIAIIQAEVDVTLAQERRSPEEYRETLLTIGSSGRRLSAVISNLFLLARVDAGQFPVLRVPTYLTDIVSESVKALRVLSERRNIELSVELPSDDAPYEGDVELLHRLVTNLVENALKHGAPQSTATVVLSESPSHYSIRVMNNGPTIPADLQSHIFDRFAQTGTERTKSGARERGAGLGLPIARWIAEAHGGTLELLWSRGGSTAFQCTLPRVSTEELEKNQMFTVSAV